LRFIGAAPAIFLPERSNQNFIKFKTDNLDLDSASSLLNAAFLPVVVT